MGWEMLPPEQPIWVSRCCPTSCVENIKKLEADNAALRERLERMVVAAVYAKVAIDNYFHKEWGQSELQDAYDKLKQAIAAAKEGK